MAFEKKQIAFLVSGLFLSAGVFAQATSNVGNITVEGAVGGTKTAHTSAFRSALGIESDNPESSRAPAIRVGAGCRARRFFRGYAFRMRPRREASPTRRRRNPECRGNR